MGDDSQRLFIEFAKRGQDSQMEDLLNENKGLLNKQDSLGNTALHWAASGGHEDCVEWLISVGANVNIQAQSGDTPLHKAAWKQNPGCCKALVKAGAKTDARNKEGKLPLDFARNSEATKRALIPEQQAAEETNPLLRALAAAANAAD
eukprot:TRINITY_DN7582_c0_g1_i1.p1 TRINITY_DN7582_c0_g1~~TRINITY_DN7582_c0_g1_i1.p1  ORF type:complete len:148 (-),score=45.78 TRINITY_DN7582_c0_g1_i1:143-586(-)